MSLFGNQNFMSQVARQMGCSNLSEQTTAMIQVLVQIETRKLIGKAGIFMNSDCRDQISFEDISTALCDLGHQEIPLVEQDQEYTRDGSSFIRRDPIFKSAKQLLQEQFKTLSTEFTGPSKLRSRWICIDGKIPRTNDNKALKCKSEIVGIREKELDEKNKKFNIIMDQPQSMLTGFQLEYYREVTSLLSDGNENISKLQGIDVTGNLSNLFPLFLKYFISSEITDIKMIYLMSLLKNKYIEKSAEFHLHQILTYLWAYEGYLSFKVGQLLGSYISKYGQKYPALYTVWIKSAEEQKLLNQESRNTVYNNTIKKIGIELVTGIEISISKEVLKCIEEDINKGIQAAVLCKQIIIEYSGVINCLKREMKYENFWIPPDGEEFGDGEEYLMMNL